MASPSEPTKNYPNFHAQKRVRRLPQLARSVGDGSAALCSDQGKCGHAARLVGLSRLTRISGHRGGGFAKREI
jgi:hypothetical protein